MIRIKRKNPTDYELLKEIEIVKKKGSIDKDFIFYNIFLKGKNIGGASVQKDADSITDVYVDKKYRLKGIGTFLYNYIENDLRIKLKPSGGKELKGHSNLGKLFWQNRLKKQNPTDKEFLSKIKIRKQKSPEDSNDLIYTAFYNKDIAAYAFITPSSECVDDMIVYDPYKRKGLASFLYNYIENDLQIRLSPSGILSKDAKAFWKVRLKK